MNRSKIAGFALALTLAAPVGLTLGSGSATGATAPAQKCGSLTGSATISPGLTFTPSNQTVVANGTMKNCTPAGATGGSGTMHATVVLKNASCNQLASGTTLPLKGSLKWKNGKSSAVALNAKTTSSAPTTATLTGKVTSGLFVGKPLAGKITFTLAGGNCSPTSPVKKITFKNTDANGKVVPFTI